MAGQVRNRIELVRKVQEQLEVLGILGQAFDTGKRVAGYPLATVIRVLVHDTPSSHALLAQLGELTTMSFIDTSSPFIPGNLLRAHGGLVMMRMTTGVGADWVPKMELPVPPPGSEPRDVSFQDWWKGDVMRDTQETMWSRRRMVLTIANKEGGAHIDPQQPVDVRAIEEGNSMGWTYSDPINGNQPMSNGPLMPSIRQIAHELEQSITRHFASEFSV